MTREEILKAAKPILFNTEMVRAILDGRKTVTRRLVKPQHLRALNSPYHQMHPEVPDKVVIEKLCMPPYLTGEYLYIRETWGMLGIDVDPIFFEHSDSLAWGQIIYKADGWNLDDIGRWRPSIHMPKEAARIFLRVTDVRIKRLQDITDEGAKAEGANYHNGKNVGVEEKMSRTAIERFAEIWDSAIKPKDRDKYGWNANPYVFVIEFERVEVD